MDGFSYNSLLGGNWKTRTELADYGGHLANQLKSRMWEPKTPEEVYGALNNTYFVSKLAACESSAFVGEFSDTVDISAGLRKF